MQTLYFASSNQGKKSEVQFFFEKSVSLMQKISLKSLSDLPDFVLKKYNPQETGKNFQENAFIKAKDLHNLFSSWIFAEDSGLEVEALGGRPGIYSARYAETDEKRINKLLSELKGKKNRKARFVTSLCFMSSAADFIYFIGRVEGNIALQASGKEGFGYDPIFIPNQSDGKTFAQMSQKEKRIVSHRGRALEQFVSFLNATVDK